MLIEWLYELKDSIDRHGIRWGVVLTLYAIFRKERRNYRLDQRDRQHNTYFKAILDNQVIIMSEMGVQPCADTLPLITQLSARIAKDGSTSSWVELLIAQSVKRFTNYHIRREIKMPINKAWVSMVVAYILAAIATKYGFTFGNEVANTITDAIVFIVLPLTLAFLNRHKKLKDEIVSIIPAAVVQAAAQPPSNYADMVPVIDAVNKEINASYELFKSGKYTDATVNAIKLYSEIHDLIKKGA